MRVWHIVLTEDNRGDVLLIEESMQLHHVPHELRVIGDGQAALDT